MKLDLSNHVGINKSAKDNNVLTKNDSESNFPIKFQTTPKRFMVWDKVGRQFLRRRLPNGVDMVFSIFELPLEIDCLDEDEKKQFIVCQSTNLFDKDGKEIFEGSVVRDFDDAIGVVYYDREDGEYRAKSSDGDSFELANSSCDLKVLGHILSNPELLEEKNV